jgi:hypothetical protein
MKCEVSTVHRENKDECLTSLLLLLLLPLLCSSERIWNRCFREVDTEGVHVQPVEEAGEALAEPRQALMHELEVHHVGLQVSHGVRQLCESWFEHIQWQGLGVPAGAAGSCRRLAEG